MTEISAEAIILHLKVESMFICYDTATRWFIICFNSTTTHRIPFLCKQAAAHKYPLMLSICYSRKGKGMLYLAPTLPTLGITHKTYYPVMLIALILVQLNSTRWWLAQVLPPTF